MTSSRSQATDHGAGRPGADAPAAAAERPLGGYEGLSTSDPREGCPRWPELLWLKWSRGELTGFVRGRCKSTNLCHYCAVQAAHENARMLSLDAVDDTQPRVLAILGTRTATTDTEPFYRAREFVIRALRDRFGRDVEYSSLQEFTTGLGPRSGGQRRPHWNLFLKGIPAELVAEAREIIRRVWCRYVDAEPDYQYVEELRDAAAAAQYVALHFQKEGQSPDVGWRGQRFNCSRGYFGDLTRAQARDRARESLRVDRELFKALRDGLEGEHAQLAADEAIEIAAATTWELHREAPPRHPLEDRHRPGPIPWFVLEAAFRWQDERDLIDEARQLVAGHLDPPGPDRGSRADVERFLSDRQPTGWAPGD